MKEDFANFGGVALTTMLCGLAAISVMVGFKCMFAAALALQGLGRPYARPIILGATAYGIAALHPLGNTRALSRCAKRGPACLGKCS
ncbi:hypothetical protein NOVOSPHI9U_310030 [Novosphingobium sp. 9U]|nr:hypothetical protein NOVOSPHI9U_310030 [Novosphingobium sp. 9U]